MKRNPVYSLIRYYIVGVVVFFILLFFGVKACGQDLKKHIAPAALVFVSGAFEGVMDHLQFHYDGNHPFWQPDISWRNKYKNRDPEQGKTFAGKYLVFTTDGWHMMKFGRNLTMFTGFTLILNTEFSGNNRKKWYWYVIEGMSYWAINRLGFNVTYNLLK